MPSGEEGGSVPVRVFRRRWSRGDDRANGSPWLRELTHTRNRLVRELEANLKQLQAILAQGQEIARDLEAVLREVRPTSGSGLPSSGGGKDGDDGERRQGSDERS